MSLYFASENTKITLAIEGQRGIEVTYATAVNTGAEHTREKVTVLGRDEAIGYTPGMHNIKDGSITLLKENWFDLESAFGSWKEMFTTPFTLTIKHIKEDGSIKKLVLNTCYFFDDEHSAEIGTRDALTVTKQFRTLTASAA